jgi:hypothetical protein
MLGYRKCTGSLFYRPEMILSSILASPLLEGRRSWSTCGRRKLILIYPSSARGLALSPLRASRDHCFIVGPLRAQRLCRLSRLLPVMGRAFWKHGSNVGVLLFCDLSPPRGVAKAALDCAHRTRAFLGRALREHRRSSGSIPPLFCEQRGHLATPSCTWRQCPLHWLCRSLMHSGGMERFE